MPITGTITIISQSSLTLPKIATEDRMRKCKVFVGSSHPKLGQLICDKLGIQSAPVTLKKFSNGETSVSIGASVRDEDVYIVQSGSSTVNDHIMELMILISACKSGSASKVTAVIPQFPYAKQSKMKRHRGAITARMLANLLIMSGADHVISMDLHASQMQGFFSKPVDNLYGAPLLANWIVNNVEDYSQAVIVSKNPGGTKRVTALADKLKVNFAMIHTDRRRTHDFYALKKEHEKKLNLLKRRQSSSSKDTTKNVDLVALRKQQLQRASSNDQEDSPIDISEGSAITFSTAADEEEEEEDPGNIILSTDLQTARVFKGHVIDDDVDDQSLNINDTNKKYGTEDFDDDDDDDDYDDDELVAKDTAAIEFELHPKAGITRSEKLITLVGDVKNRPAIILDDMIDKPNSFIAAAEHCRLNCGSSRVIIIATHGTFSNNCLEKLNESPCIDKIVVTNTFPISKEAIEKNEKLIVLDVSPVFAECIRRDHYGESVSVLFDNLVIS